MTIPTYFTTSPINGGSAVTLNVPPVGGIIYDFIGSNGLRITAFVNGSSMPSFTSSGGTSRLLNSFDVSTQLVAALGGGIQQLAVRLTVDDGDSAASEFDFNEAFLNINGVSQMLNTSVMDTFNHDSNGDATSTALVPGYPNELLATGWGLVTNSTILTNVYNSLVSTGKIDLYWESVPGGGGNVLNFGSGLNSDYLSEVSYPSIAPTAQVTLNLQPGIDNGISTTDLITSNATLVLQGNAFPGQVLEIYNGETLVDTVTTNASASWSYTFTTALPDAVHNLIVKAVDGSGKVTGTSNPLGVTIDTVAPLGASSIPDMTAATDTGPSDNDNITSNRRPTFTGTAEPNATVSLYDGTTLVATVPVDEFGDWSYTPSSDLADGSYSYKARVSDVAGNNSNSPDSGVLNFLVNSSGTQPIDPTPPGLGGSGNAGNGNEGLTNNNRPPLQGVVTPGSTVEILVNGQPLPGVATVNSDGTWGFIPDSGLPDGTYELVVRATTPGVGVVNSTPSTLTIDTLPANVEILSFGDNVRDSNVNAISFKFSELVNNVKLSDIELTLDGQPIDLTSAQLSTQDNLTFSLENIPGFTTSSGNYQISIKPSNTITDRAGNTLTIGSSGTWLTGYTADAFAAQKFKGGKSGMKAFGTGESNTFRGSRLNDVMRGMAGNDKVQGRGGNDKLSGGGGKDSLTGGLGKDRLRGQGGSDRIFGRQGKDLLLGGGGNDRILGGGGDDVLVGGNGNDTLTGGKGSDTFRYTSVNEGTDTITDFTVGVDLIDMRRIFDQSNFNGPNRFAKFNQFVDLVQVGSNVEVRIDADGSGSGTALKTLAVLSNQSTNAVTSRSFVVG